MREQTGLRVECGGDLEGERDHVLFFFYGRGSGLWETFNTDIGKKRGASSSLSRSVKKRDRRRNASRSCYKSDVFVRVDER